ncbi:hypothetical protein H634G_05387 [Metarhizium anisopliae BRIP 53293]|uniref:Uncharacterized protein n=1 Tax=Metarhizium anisopliae BRIP 53293 TaxID=1291518 RepID=A0A0D9NYM6_METAN|nr:hypothetical protein H634G_05387 [Metarhizium anisopliae BRIP 53293]KJK87522.1 hypothetical protein H633G_08611 [Metarhizium anisopliae BRIP 53284]
MSRSSDNGTICIRPDRGLRRDNTQQSDNHTIVKQAFANSIPQIMAIIWEEMEKLQRDTDNGQSSGLAP